MNIKDDYIHKEKIKNLLGLLSSETKVEILHGKLFLNDQIISDKNKSITIVAEVAYLMSIRIFNGVSKKGKLCKVKDSKRSPSIELMWIDIVTGDLYPQFFNDTAIRKGVNKKDIGSSKNGLLYRTFVKMTGITPKASRIPITKLTNLFVHAETKKFGQKGDHKIVNSTLKNVYIQYEEIEKNLPEEYKKDVPFNTLPMYVKRTKQTQIVQKHYTEHLHNDDSLDVISRGMETNQNAYNLNTLKVQHSQGQSQKCNGLRYTYDTEAEIEPHKRNRIN